VSGFWMDSHPVTVAEFRAFVDATAYVTCSERPLDSISFPGADPDLLVPGSVVFEPTQHAVNLDDFRLWWRYVPVHRGARLRAPPQPPIGSTTTRSSRSRTKTLPRTLPGPGRPCPPRLSGSALLVEDCPARSSPTFRSTRQTEGSARETHPARTCARRITGCATDRPPARRKPSTRPQLTSVFGACCARSRRRGGR
jgi:hypothetical protein